MTLSSFFMPYLTFPSVLTGNGVNIELKRLFYPT
uniref:Uncharacterized protein n=1 Tax=Arundo donax TaxID=35708 RepID=A0A0A8ZBI6_ARUDO